MEKIKYSAGQFLLLCLIVCVALCVPFESHCSMRPDTVQWKGDRVSIRGRHIPVKKLLQRLSEFPGVQIFVFDAIDSKNVNLDIEGMRFGDAVRSVLNGINYAVLYNPCDRIFEKGPVVVMQQKAKRKKKIPGAAVDGNMSPGRGDSRKSNEMQLAGIGSSNHRTVEIIHDAGPNNGSVPRRVHKKVTMNTYQTGFSSQGTAMNPDLFKEYEDAEIGYGPDNGNSETAHEPEEGNPEAYGDYIEDNLFPDTEKEWLEQMIENLETRIASGQSDLDYQRWADIKGDSRYVQHDADLLDYYMKRLETI